MPAQSLPIAPTLTLAEVVTELIERHPDAITVSTCGFTSRELFNAADRPENFYLVGSMGMAAPIALGVALARPGRTVIALDGDGSLLMNLSALPLVAASGTQLLHVVIDNGMHESTGGQATVQRSDFVALALAAGYRGALRVADTTELRAARLPKGPALLHALTGPRTGGPGRRVTHSPQEIVQRVNTAVNRPAA
ncbi:thiamine pyrophosphate-dependent enzyme [Streptomyces sp. CSDS2]|uniref:thiamine pyrophosphate-dependent enzyme n=1 Tax=Streptomyces sp. CSDS2 TaxID=3055051 RepID=UPI0025B133E9|nr:thiamine pyrophosphate-dependent enzyme [Streptomyces sp. CSDS2]MDN3260532.1 thiamine pyrophosphate-dependent enzyme [Streptomyces sp. CSDS2]